MQSGNATDNSIPSGDIAFDWIACIEHTKPRYTFDLNLISILHMAPSLMWIAQCGKEGRKDKEKRRGIVRSHVMTNFQADLRKRKVRNSNGMRRRHGGPDSRTREHNGRATSEDFSQRRECSRTMDVLLAQPEGQFDPFDSLPARRGDPLCTKMLYFCKQFSFLDLNPYDLHLLTGMADFNFIPMVVPDCSGMYLCPSMYITPVCNYG
jgi:hypothetical protein